MFIALGTTSCAISSAIPIGGWHQRTAEMDIALRDAAGGMPKESGNVHLCEPELRCNACKRMSEDVPRDILELCLGADAIKNSHDADEVTITPISRKEERRLLVDRLVCGALVTGPASENLHKLSQIKRISDQPFYL